MRKRVTAREMSRVALFAAIIAASAHLSVPLPGGVPLTLQTLAVPLAGILLGPWDGAVAALIYVLLGAAGLPIFAGFRGGLDVVFGATGGFILSFPLMALVAGLGSGNLTGWRGMARLVAALTVGAAVNYAFGMFFFAAVRPCDVRTAFAACVLPFIPTAVLKIALAAALGRAIKSRVFGLLRTRKN